MLITPQQAGFDLGRVSDNKVRFFVEKKLECYNGGISLQKKLDTLVAGIGMWSGLA